MSKIVFFSIPAYGHTNPTIAVVDELVKRGNKVWYYSFNIFQEKLESVGAKFISCDKYLPELQIGDERKIGRDFSALIEMVVNTTINLDEKVCSELKEIKPDCIVSDSLCFWGKLFARKLNIKYICSTTSFAFNKYTAKMIKRGVGEIIRTIIGIPKINRMIKLLNSNGYNVKGFTSLIENNNDTNTIVYTSKEFQPIVESFSDKYVFVGPSIVDNDLEEFKGKHKLVYISLGTILNKNNDFYKMCIRALGNLDINVIMSVGKDTNILELGDIPDNFEVKNRVDQISVLKKTSVFITHCGMNSVSESLYYRVPMVLFPQHSEEAMVARRVVEVGAGVMLNGKNIKSIKDSVVKILENDLYRKSAEEISKGFKVAGGSRKAADMILRVIEDNENN